MVSKMNRFFINKLWIGELQNIICNIFTHQLQTRRKFSVQLIFFFFFSHDPSIDLFSHGYRKNYFL